MERHLSPEDARGATSRQPDSTATLADDFSRALAAPDIALARRIVSDALVDGASPGRIYVEVVRPALSRLQLDGTAVRERLIASACRAILADIVGALPVTDSVGPGRAALLSCRSDGIERIDGELAIDFLEADGWAVQRLHGPRAALSLGPAARADSIELAVAVVAGPEDALRLAPACTALRRLPDPPVVLLCDFTGRSDWPAASTALGADAFCCDPEELALNASRRLPAAGIRRWGVQISRRRDTLVLTPTGRLDAISARRLADVVTSRIGTFSRLIIDLRDLAELSVAGLEDVCGWRDRGSLQGLELQLIGDQAVRSRIGALGPGAPPLDAVVALADAAVGE